MMKIRTITAAAFLMMLLPAFSIFAQDSGGQGAEDLTGPEKPVQTEIILPKMYLEVEDLTIEEINAVIPDDSDVVLSSLELPLPEPDQISIPAEAFALSVMAAPSTLIPPETGGGSSSSFFSESTIGAGTSSRISADINLYHIGGQPDFRLKYFHDSYDGFAGFAAGEGASFREELVEAEFNFNLDKLSSDLLVSYNETENGLQGQTDYFSATSRSPEISGSLEWDFAKLFSLTGNIDASTAGLQLNSALSPLSFDFLNLQPEAGIVFGTDSYNVGLAVDYGLNGSTDGGGLYQNLGAELKFRLEPADVFRVSGNAGIFWNDFSELYYPFNLKISGNTADFEYGIGGGYTVGYGDYRELWDVFPAAAGPSTLSSMPSLPLTTGWTAEGTLSWTASEMVSVRAGAEFSSLENALVPVVSAVNGFYNIAGEDSIRLDASAGVYLQLLDGLSINASWDGQLLEQIDWFRPRHNFNAEVEFVSETRDIGITAGLGFNVYDSLQLWYANDWLPVINLEAFLRFTEGFVLSISAEDAAALLGDGRTVWGDYLDRGSMLQAKIKISL